MNNDSKKAIEEAKEIREPEIVCWVPHFVDEKKPRFSLAQSSKANLRASICAPRSSYTCLPLIVKPD